MSKILLALGVLAFGFFGLVVIIQMFISLYSTRDEKKFTFLVRRKKK